MENIKKEQSDPARVEDVSREAKKLKKVIKKIRTLEFTGSCDNSYLYIFIVSNFTQTEQCTKTLKRITGYIGQNYKGNRDILRSLEEFQEI